jgi:surfeit locus 1 family protein
MLSGDERRRAIIVLLATIAGVALTARLGFWQLDRAAQKVAIQAQIDARRSQPPLDAATLADTPQAADSQHQRRAALRGRWIAARTVFLDNRQMNGMPGFFVVTPLQLDGRAAAVLVQRGWVPRNFRDRAALPAVPTPGGPVEVEGVVAPPPSRLYQFSNEASGPIRQNLPLDAYARETGLALLPLSVLQSDSAGTRGDGLQRRWPAPELDVSKHYGYAFQWFAMAALMVGLYVWFQLLRPARRHA